MDYLPDHLTNLQIIHLPQCNEPMISICTVQDSAGLQP